jgi:hypothetical protein
MYVFEIDVSNFWSERTAQIQRYGRTGRGRQREGEKKNT